MPAYRSQYLFKFFVKIPRRIREQLQSMPKYFGCRVRRMKMRTFLNMMWVVIHTGTGHADRNSDGFFVVLFWAALWEESKENKWEKKCGGGQKIVPDCGMAFWSAFPRRFRIFAWRHAIQSRENLDEMRIIIKSAFITSINNGRTITQQELCILNSPCCDIIPEGCSRKLFEQVAKSWTTDI